VVKKTVLMQEVMRSGKQKDKSVPMTLTLTDADSRPSQVRRSVSCDDNDFHQKSNNQKTIAAKRRVSDGKRRCS